jgi:hypothetical protein
MSRFLTLLVALMLVTTGSYVRARSGERTYASENFRITWVDDARDRAAPDLSDEDGDGVPDAVVRLAVAFEGARSFLLNELGYLAPPVEGRYRIYIANGAIRLLRAPGGVGNSDASFIIVNPAAVQSATTDDRMRSLAVHEYFHAIQVGYDSSERHWIKEASSTWVEDEFIDAADPNHGAVLGFLPFPRIGLEAAEGDHEYGAFIFLQFLVERYGDATDPRSLVRELWEEMSVPESPPSGPDRDAIGAIVAVLQRRGVSLYEAWREFTVWQRRIGLFEEGASYKQIAAPSPWPTFLDSFSVAGESCRHSTDRSRFDVLPPLSADYVRFEPDDGAVSDAASDAASDALVTVEGPPAATAFALVKRAGGETETFNLTFSEDGVAQISVPFAPNDVKRVVVGLGNASPVDDASLFYSLRRNGADETELTGPTGPYQTIYGLATPFSGQVSCGGVGQPNAPIEITERENVSGITRTYIVRSFGTGGWSTLITPLVNSTYSARLVDPLLGPGTANDWQVAVIVSISIEVADDRVQPGEPVHVTGTLVPAHPDSIIAIEFRRPDGLWQFGTETRPDADGNFSADVPLPDDGIWYVRARMTTTGDEDHEPGTSTERVVEVTTE